MTESSGKRPAFNNDDDIMTSEISEVYFSYFYFSLDLRIITILCAVLSDRCLSPLVRLHDLLTCLLFNWDFAAFSGRLTEKAEEELLLRLFRFECC